MPLQIVFTTSAPLHFACQHSDRNVFVRSSSKADPAVSHLRLAFKCRDCYLAYVTRAEAAYIRKLPRDSRLLKATLSRLSVARYKLEEMFATDRVRPLSAVAKDVRHFKKFMRWVQWNYVQESSLQKWLFTKECKRLGRMKYP